MSDEAARQRAIIDALFDNPNADPVPVRERLLKLARTGVDKPGALTDHEVQQVCYALIVHFHQIGIS